MCELQLAKALGVLKAFSFVREDKGHGFDMHRLVQLVTRKWLVNKGITCHFATRAISTVSYNYPYGDHEHQATCGAYLAHAYVALELEGTGSRDEGLAKAVLLHRAAGYFVYHGQCKAAEGFLLQATKVRTELLGGEHPNTLTSMSNLASRYWDQGRWKEAESLMVQVKNSRKRVLGEEHSNTLTSMSILAFTWHSQGRVDESLRLMEQCVQLRQRVLGLDHPDTMVSSSWLREWKEASAPI